MSRDAAPQLGWLDVLQKVPQNGPIKLDVRRTTPFTAEDYEQVRAFVAAGTPEHDALERLSPVPLRDGSEGATLRALTLLGMAYVRERGTQAHQLADGYEQLAADRRQGPVRPPGCARTWRDERARPTRRSDPACRRSCNSWLEEFIAVRMTTTRRPTLPTWVLLGPPDRPWVSVACDDIGPIYRDQVIKAAGALTGPAMRRVEQAILTVLGIDASRLRA